MSNFDLSARKRLFHLADMAAESAEWMASQAGGDMPVDKFVLVSILTEFAQFAREVRDATQDGQLTAREKVAAVQKERSEAWDT